MLLTWENEAFLAVKEQRFAGIQSCARIHFALSELDHADPVVRVELVREGGDQTVPIQAEISRERFRELKLVAGDRVFIRPRRFDLFPSQLH